MPLIVVCAECKKKLKLREELAGKKVKCPCGAVVAVPVEEVEELEEVEERPAVTARPAKSQPKVPVSKVSKGTPPPEVVPAEDTGCEVWKCQSGGGIQLLVLEDEGVWSAYPSDEDYKDIAQDLKDGVNPEKALGKDAKFYAFRDLTEVSSNLKTRSLMVTTKIGDDESSETWHFKDHDRRDDALDAIERRLGPDFEYKRRDLNRFQAAGSPLVTILVLLGLTAFFVFMAWAIENPGDGGGRTRVVRTNILGIIALYTVGFIGSFWTGVVGGICVLLAGVWLVVRVADPPIEVTIKPREVGKGSGSRKKRRRDEED